MRRSARATFRDSMNCVVHWIRAAEKLSKCAVRSGASVKDTSRNNVDFERLDKRIAAATQAKSCEHLVIWRRKVLDQLVQRSQSRDKVIANAAELAMQAHVWADGLATLRISDARPSPNVADVFRWSAQYTYAML